MTSLGTVAQALQTRDLYMKGMVAGEDSRHLSAIRARDVNAALSTRAAAKMIREQSEVVLVLVSSFLLGAILFLVLL